MSTDKTLADVQPGGRVRLEQEARDHRWNDVGERCLDCGDKDWMGGACSGPRSTAATGPWLSITNAPNDGQQHIRGLWVTSRIDGKPDTREWRQFIGVVNDEGAFVDPDYGETFGWEADEYDAWMPAAVAPGAALSAQPSQGGQGAPFPWENFPAYLIDKCEGDTISEEGLQQALAAMAKDERYGVAARQPVVVDLPESLHDRVETLREVAARQPVRIYGCCAQPEGELHTAECPNMRHLAARQPVTMDDALAAGDGTLHGAIDHWQERALRAEAELAARQPVGENAEVSKVMERCIRELRSFINVAHDYDLDEMAVQALETAIESMEIRKQPAQAVELGAVREALQAAEGLATVCASVDGYSREEVAASGRAMKQQFSDALAKIDSQAVGK